MAPSCFSRALPALIALFLTTICCGQRGIERSRGVTLDVNGDRYADVLVGAPQAKADIGRAYVYLGSPTGLTMQPATTLENPAGTFGDFGAVVVNAGDLNGDGYADVVVGAPRANEETGRAYVFLGSANGLRDVPATTLDAPDPSTVTPGPPLGTTPAHFGSAIAGVGDINKDGFADLVVAAFGAKSLAGRAYLYLGGSGGLPAAPAVTLSVADPMAQFGFRVAGVGDVNGDGNADVAVSTYPLNSANGAVHVYHGSKTGLGTTPAATLAAPAAASRDHFAYSLASAGDVNGDGYADLVVGTLPIIASSSPGEVFVYLGGPTGLSLTPATTISSPDGAGIQFGEPVAAGDVNADGYADVVVSAPAWNSYVGRVYVYPGGASGVATKPSMTMTGPDGGSFGCAIASPGDVDANGNVDLVIGASTALTDPSGAGPGRVYFFAGSTRGLGGPAATILTGPDGSGGRFGAAVD